MGVDRPSVARLPDARGRRVAVVAARFNAEITDGLLAGALAALAEAGLAPGDVEQYRVPGAFELPIVVQRVLRRREIDGVVALGAVVRGETPHFTYVSRAVTDGLVRVALDAGKPVAFGVLTTDTPEQARARAAPGPENKGREAVAALLETLAVLEELGP